MTSQFWSSAGISSSFGIGLVALFFALLPRSKTFFLKTGPQFVKVSNSWVNPKWFCLKRPKFLRIKNQLIQLRSEIGGIFRRIPTKRPWRKIRMHRWRTSRIWIQWPRPNPRSDWTRHSRTCHGHHRGWDGTGFRMMGYLEEV